MEEHRQAPAGPEEYGPVPAAGNPPPPGPGGMGRFETCIVTGSAVYVGNELVANVSDSVFGVRVDPLEFLRVKPLFRFTGRKLKAAVNFVNPWHREQATVNIDPGGPKRVIGKIDPGVAKHVIKVQKELGPERFRETMWEAMQEIREQEMREMGEMREQELGPPARFTRVETRVGVDPAPPPAHPRVPPPIF